MTRSLRIAFLGGVPASLGGGGLELQLARTAAALTRRGHDVFHVAREPAPRPFDVLHAFSSEPDIWHTLLHWRINAAPFVITPVCVVEPGWPAFRARIGSRLPIPAFAPRMRVSLVRQAQAVVVANEAERRLLEQLVGELPHTEVIGNAVDPTKPIPSLPAELSEGYVALLGTVSRRKSQRAAVEVLGRAGIPAVVIGGFDGPETERTRFEGVMKQARAQWLGEVHDPATVREILRRARALLHPSTAEVESIAVLEALSVGTPVLVRPIPANQELARRYPEHVHVLKSLDAAPEVLSGVRRPAAPPAVPTWDDVAQRLESLYEFVLAPVSGRGPAG